MRAFAPERRGVIMGWRQMAVPLGGTIGAIALPLLADAGGVRLALVACAAATATTVGRVRPPGGPCARRRARSLRAGASSTCCGRRASGRPSSVATIYIVGLSAVLTYYIPAARAAGLTRSQAAIGFTLVNVVAGISRPLWGRLADRDGGTRRTRTLRDTGIVGAVAAVFILPALHAGVAARPGGDRGPGLRHVRLQRHPLRDRRRARGLGPVGRRGGPGVDGRVRRRRAGDAGRGRGRRAAGLRRAVGDHGGRLRGRAQSSRRAGCRPGATAG